MQRRLLVVVTVGLVLLGACGQSGDTGGKASPSAAPSTATSPSAAAGSSAPQPPTRCTTSDLRFSLSRGDGAAGSTFYLLRITNASASTCRTGGFGGVSFVATPGGPPIGAPADRVQRAAARTLTLLPGDTAEATLRQTNADNFSRSACRPAPAKGLQVYPPDETRSSFVRHAATACSSRRARLLELSPYRRAG